MERESFRVSKEDELERSGRWALVRRSLDVKSMGMNVVELEPGGALPEHDEVGRDQEEVFVVLSGDAAIVIDGQEHPAPAGTFARIDPQPLRTVVNTGSEPVRLLIVSAPTTSGYEPDTWN
jgi:quercetin dioxygenase-like cupin family protein